MSPGRLVVAGVVAGALLVGSAWAGIGLVPVRVDDTPLPTLPGAPTPEAGRDTRTTRDAAPNGDARLPDGALLVGADVTPLTPDPDRWQTTDCVTLDDSAVDPGLTHLADKAVADMTGSWPRSPDCIYLGGYGIGPMRPATGVDPYAGINVRSVAISNGSDTVLWQIVDMVGFFARYRDDLCDGCGILDIRRAIGAKTGLPLEAIAIGSTHTHGGADGYGAWGGLPTWYREQVRDAVIASALAAVDALEPATLTIGGLDLRAFNNERRDHYYSTPDYGAVWLQARSAAPGRRGDVLATLVNYAAHPVVLGTQTLLHGDWPAVSAKVLGADLGGVGLVFEGGLGNVSPAGARADHDHTGDGEIDDYDKVVDLGSRIAGAVAADIEHGGTALSTNDIRAVRVPITHPATNTVLVGGALGGLLDRDFAVDGDAAAPGGAYEWAKQSTSPRRCVTVGPLSIVTEVAAYRIGGLLTVVTGPGELFSNLTEVLKSKARAGAETGGRTMVFSQTQDSLGYIIQSFEVDPVGGVAEYVPQVDVAEYEEFFMVDRCFGDHVLQTQLDAVGALG
jgi:hypothetical protein